MPSRRTSSDGSIDKLDFDAHRRRPSTSSRSSRNSSRHNLLSSNESFFSDVVSGVIARDRLTLSLKVTRIISFVCAILNSLCAGSITAYSLYAPLFISHLEYSQYQVNAVSTTAELGMYLPVPLIGWLCDRYSPRPVSLVSGTLFGGGYALAAMVYGAGPRSHEVDLQKPTNGQDGWPFGIMILAFVLVGSGTVSMYMSAVTTCAKNFGRGKHKGFALGAPIAAFGLSGMWQSQLGSHLFKERETGDMDAFRYFIFLAALQFAVGVIGSLGLRIVDEDSLSEEPANDLERSGLLYHDPQPPTRADHPNNNSNGYGAIAPSTHAPLSKFSLLGHSTRAFLTDPTMYLITLGFFLTSGPGETYLNNVGTLVHTAYRPPSHIPSINTPATHVSLLALTSTLARLISGTVSDFLAPSTPTATRYPGSATPPQNEKRFTVSRLWFLLPAILLFSLALLLLSTPLPNMHPRLLPFCTSLVGLGYGVIFSLTPILVSVVWGVENFGTNWGIVTIVPAPGAALWGAVYSAVYSAGAGDGGGSGMGQGGTGGDGRCYGAKCYQRSFAAMTVATWVAIAAWVWAWKGWRARGVAV